MKIEELVFGSRKAIVGWNTLAQFVGKVVSAGTMFLISVLIARSFGADGFGDFTKITTYIAFYYLLADFGLNAVYLQKEQKSANNWSTLLELRLVGSLFLMALSLVVLAFLPRGTTQGYTELVRLGIILYSPTILFQALVSSANAVFQKHLRYDLATVALAIGNLVSLVLVMLVVMYAPVNAGAVFSVAALLAGITVVAVTSLFFVKHFGPLRLSWHFQPLRQLLIASLPLGLMLLFNQVYFRFDSFVITLSRSTVEVGIYGLAYKVFELPLVVPTFFMNAMYPLMLKVGRQEAAAPNYELKRLIYPSLIFLLFVSGFMVGVFWLTAPLLTLVRPEFAQSIPALRVLVLSLPFFFTTNLLLWVVVALEKQKILPFIYGLSMLLIIILDLRFIPAYGYLAAAWITVFTEGVVLMILTLTVYRLLRSGHNRTISQSPNEGDKTKRFK